MENGLTIKKAASKLGLCAKTVRRMVKDGSLDGHKVQGKRGLEWRVSAASLENHAGTIEGSGKKNGKVHPGASTINRNNSPEGDVFRQLVGTIDKLTNGLNDKEFAIVKYRESEIGLREQITTMTGEIATVKAEKTIAEKSSRTRGWVASTFAIATAILSGLSIVLLMPYFKLP